MTVLFTPQAETQLLDALDFIRNNNPSAAVSFKTKVAKKLGRLEAFPNSGRFVPEFPDPLVREIIISPYRLFYRVENEIVWIFAVWHSAQIPDNPNN